MHLKLLQIHHNVNSVVLFCLLMAMIDCGAYSGFFISTDVLRNMFLTAKWHQHGKLLTSDVMFL